MEVPEQHLQGLKMMVHMSEMSFRAIMKQAILEGTDSSQRQHVSSLLATCSDCDAPTVRAAHAALLASLVEHARHAPAAADTAGQVLLRDALTAAAWPHHRQVVLMEAISQARGDTRSQLASIGHGCDKLVDIGWRELVTVQSSLAGPGSPEFELTLVTRATAGGDTRERVLTCSREQLQDTLTALRRAGKALEMFSEGTAALPER